MRQKENFPRSSENEIENGTHLLNINKIYINPIGKILLNCHGI